jgi:hypothetical protein
MAARIRFSASASGSMGGLGAFDARIDYQDLEHVFVRHGFALHAAG